MNALDGFEVLLAGAGTLPLAAGLARLALNALFACLQKGTEFPFDGASATRTHVPLEVV